MKYVFCWLAYAIFFSSPIFSQNINSNVKQGISQYYTDNSDQPLSKWLIANKIVMSVKGQNVNGYYGWAAQGSASYYFEGKLNGNIITGKKYDLGGGDGSTIIINVMKSAVSLISPIGKVNVPLDKNELFADTKILTIYEQPDKKSNIIKSEYELFNKGFTLIEIGKMEKDPNNFGGLDIWYKIKNSSIEGWVFGLLNVF
jgi:hypothetical protein